MNTEKTLKPVEHYKIRHKITGLYKLGGSSTYGFHTWSKNGKTWGSLGALKNHLRTYDSKYGDDFYKTPELSFKTNDYLNWEIIKVKFIPEIMHTTDMKDFIEQEGKKVKT